MPRVQSSAAKVLEIYCTLSDNRAFFEVADITKSLTTQADRADSRFPLWRSVRAIGKSRQAHCVSAGPAANPAVQVPECRHGLCGHASSKQHGSYRIFVRSIHLRRTIPTKSSKLKMPV